MPVATTENLQVNVSDQSVFAALSSSTLVTNGSNEADSFGVENSLNEKSKNAVGTATFKWPSGAAYTGQFSNGQRNGNGLQTWQDGSSYKGEFLNDMRHGLGVHTWSSEEVFIFLFLAIKVFLLSFLQTFLFC